MTKHNKLPPKNISCKEEEIGMLVKTQQCINNDFILKDS